MSRTLWHRVMIAAVYLLLAACSETPGQAGFAGLAESAPQSSFRQPSPGDRIRFPEAWGAHPAYRIEWWYLTANLETAGGQPMGLQWTQFRQGLEPRAPGQPAPPASAWPLESAWMAHGAVSFRGHHWFD